jgi:hypothetical protein
MGENRGLSELLRIIELVKPDSSLREAAEFTDFCKFGSSPDRDPATALRNCADNLGVQPLQLRLLGASQSDKIVGVVAFPGRRELFQECGGMDYCSRRNMLLAPALHFPAMLRRCR